jgi:Lectin C-type domain
MVEAMEYCCQLGMSLLSMETAAETDCIGKWVRESLSNLLPVWTSGTDHNCKGKYAWCSTGEMFAREAFHQFFIPTTGDDDSNLDHHCVSAVFQKEFPLRHHQCDNKFSFICEKTGKYGRTEMWPQSPSLRHFFNTTYL